ncbi:HAD-IB family hydrolase [Candidatus Saccharibacteria bacterium CG10_big_fil_rev_8_21_14_0_10_47_8]|nr:MAG: HAD-IB family hydrolase [Candidatus Saccharibacteria bacterium CG10_big_fil_rev_8_21_14_0_10_47_8]
MDKYSARASQPVTQQSAKNAVRVSGSAGKQDSMTQRPFAVFDIDGTLIRWQLYHATADALADAGHTDEATFRAAKEARMQWKRRTARESFKDYEKELIKAYEGILLMLSPAQIEQVAQAVFDEYKDQVYTYTRDLVKNLKNRGYTLLAISGSQLEIVAKIAKYYGFDDCVGTVYEQSGGKFTGGKTIGSANKAATLKSLITKHHLSLVGSVAVGDSASDVSMMELVELPIALNPEKKLYEHAKKRSWKIVLERKNMVYELEATDGNYRLAKAN